MQPCNTIQRLRAKPHLGSSTGCGGQQPALRCRPSLARRSHKVRAIVKPDETRVKADDCDGMQGRVYPDFEESKPNEGLFPVREPGNFPDVDVVHNEIGFWQTMTVDFSEDASLDENAFDPLRDGPLRFLGYSNEVGEAFAAWLPAGGVPLTYGLAIAYVLVDTYDKGLKAYRRARQELDGSAELDPSVDKQGLARLLSAERALDTVVWQLIASVAAPGYTIHTVVALTTAGLAAAEALQGVQDSVAGVASSLGVAPDALLAVANKSLPTAVGLAAIPFIVHPIDNGVHWVLNKTLRPALRSYVCGQGKGSLAKLAMCDEECAANWGGGGGGNH